MCLFRSGLPLQRGTGRVLGDGDSAPGADASSCRQKATVSTVDISVLKSTNRPTTEHNAVLLVLFWHPCVCVYNQTKARGDERGSSSHFKNHRTTGCNTKTQIINASLRQQPSPSVIIKMFTAASPWNSTHYASDTKLTILSPLPTLYPPYFPILSIQPTNQEPSLIQTSQYHSRTLSLPPSLFIRQRAHHPDEVTSRPRHLISKQHILHNKKIE